MLTKAKREEIDANLSEALIATEYAHWRFIGMMKGAMGNEAYYRVAQSFILWEQQKQREHEELQATTKEAVA